MVGWRAAGARALLRRLGAAVAEKQDGRVFSASYSSSCSRSANAPFALGACIFISSLYNWAALVYFLFLSRLVKMWDSECRNKMAN
jgi:hypothetical protein